MLVLLLTSQCYAQKQKIFLQKQEPAKQITSTYLYEDKNITRYQIPEGIEDFVIGCLSISGFHSLYNERHKNKSNLIDFQILVAENDIDTMQFVYNKLIKTSLNVLIYIQDGAKHCIIDSDFDNSFLNESVFSFNMKNTIGNNTRFFTNLLIPMDSFGYSVSRQTPIGIDMISNGSVTGNNVVADSLQVDIFSDISYRSFFIDDTDTIWIDIISQNFDQLYTKKGMLGICSNITMNFWAPLILGSTFQVGKHKYRFEDFDIYNKTLVLTRLEDDNRGTNRGNFFAEMPELSSFSGYSLIFFTGSWCRPCKPVLDSLLVFHQRFPEITIININQERDSMIFTKYLNDNNIPWKAICDIIDNGKSLYFSTYCIYEVPQLLLVNSQRRVLLCRKGTNPCIELLKEIKEKGFNALEINDY